WSLLRRLVYQLLRHSHPPPSLPFSLFSYCSRPHRHLLSFPTRRSSDLAAARARRPSGGPAKSISRASSSPGRSSGHSATRRATSDRKSTRLNSSHGSISYAVFCLKKKKKK